MRRTILSLFLMLFIFFNNSSIGVIKGDVIPIFLKEFIDGKEIEWKIYLEIKIYEDKGKIKWLLNQIEFSDDDYNKSTAIQVFHSRSDDTFALPSLKKVKWEPGKYFECIYDYSWPITLKARKKKSGEYNWEVVAEGQYTVESDNSTHKMELKGVKEIKLKYKKLRMVNLYYR